MNMSFDISNVTHDEYVLKIDLTPLYNQGFI